MGDPQTPPPTLRDNHRYIVFRVDSETTPDFSAVYDAAWDAFLSFLGVHGTAQAAPWIMKDLWNEEEQTGGIQVVRGFEQDVVAALTLITAVAEEPARIHVLDVTGTVKKARTQYPVAD